MNFFLNIQNTSFSYD